LSDISLVERAPQGAVQLIVRGEVAALPLQGVSAIGTTKRRLEKELARVQSDIARIDGKLANADFVARAPEDVVDGEREKRDDAEIRRVKINEALEGLKGAACTCSSATGGTRNENGERRSREDNARVLGCGRSALARR